ncbi:MAG: CCA tRNA nucleotidyltransferase [Pseudomonadota bacterium]
MTRITGEWLEAEASQRVCAMLEAGGHQAWFVGGCVRNALLGAPVTDLDISTDALPERVSELAKAAGMRAVPTGIEHGTVTVVHGGVAFEVTTFRKDVETDGRHAVVAFAETLEEDAERRDFTMNALYADARGDLRDPVGGIADLEAQHFRFIGDAEARIREDYLRILRFFRFFAWYGRELDPDGLAACAAFSAGLETLSAERVTSEMVRLLSAPDPLRAVAAMEQAGVLARVLPGASAKVLGPYLHLDPSQIDAMARLAALGGEAAGLKLSRAQARDLETYREAMESEANPGALGYRLGATRGLSAVALRAAAFEQPLTEEAEAVALGARSVFPVKAADLPPALEGPEIGAALKRLETMWIAESFAPSKAELLSRL